MVTTLKNSAVQKWTWTGARFIRQKPGEKQLAAPKCLQLYKRARFYDPTTGEFISQDPLGDIDGSTLYRLYALINGVDFSGLNNEQTTYVVAKSFINGAFPTGTIDWRQGLPLPLPPIPGLDEKWNGPGKHYGNRLKWAAMNIFKHLPPFNENPLTDPKDGKYRLYTRYDVTYCCENGNIEIQSVENDMDGGLEQDTSRWPWPFNFGVIAGTINIDKEEERLNGGKYVLSWRGYGKPHILAEPGMQWIGIRTSKNIWHEVELTIECKGNSGKSKISSFDGSMFPTHRVWLDGKLDEPHFTRKS